jgi:hypothetical protein
MPFLDFSVSLRYSEYIYIVMHYDRYALSICVMWGIAYRKMLVLLGQEIGQDNSNTSSVVHKAMGVE